MASDVDLERLAHQAEDDLVLADIVPRADGVIADLVARTLTGLTLAAMAVTSLSHFGRDDLAELQGRSARGVFFEAVVSFDDFDVDAIRNVLEGSGRLSNELHRDVDRQAHAGSEDDRGELGRGGDLLPLVFVQARGRDDDRDPPFSADGDQLHRRFRHREIDDHVGRRR